MCRQAGGVRIRSNENIFLTYNFIDNRVRQVNKDKANILMKKQIAWENVCYLTCCHKKFNIIVQQQLATTGRPAGSRAPAGAVSCSSSVMLRVCVVFFFECMHVNRNPGHASLY